MPDFRVFCAPTTPNPCEIRLDAAESHHLVAVNRARIGNEVIAFDGSGREWICVLAAAGKREACLEVQQTREAKRFPYELALGQAIPKGKTMDAIVRKATEIGVSEIIPLVSERTEVQLEAERQEYKLEKWRAAAVEAAKQCGNPFLPNIAPVQRATDVFSSNPGFELRLVASLHPGAKTLKTVLGDFRDRVGRTPAKVLWFVGPEGDFTPKEMAAAVAAGVEPITLGPLVLRCETAAVYALSILSYELQNA